jgi:ATP-dependent DNA ligase
VLNDDWLKIKCLRVHDFVIRGWISNTNKDVGALLLGEFIDGDLRYVGQVGSPSDSRAMRAVARVLSPRASSPFRDAISAPDARFCEPALRAAVEFLDFLALVKGWAAPELEPVYARAELSNAIADRGGHEKISGDGL